jgi:hypothetical protein
VTNGRGKRVRPPQREARPGAGRAAKRRREAPPERNPRVRARHRRRPSLRGRRVPSWLLPLVVLVAVGFLYVRPISAYLETRSQLSDRRAEVAELRAERARVGARLERATSLEELARAARKIGYVRPEEHLFIVKGTAAWARRHSG